LATNFDIFINLSGPSSDGSNFVALLALFRERSGLAVEGRRITVALDEDATADCPGFTISSRSAGEALSGALATAGAARRGLVVIQGAWIPECETVLALTRYQDADPMVGTVQPRFASAADEWIIGLPGTEPSTELMLPRVALGYLPETYLSPELPAPLLLIPPRAVRATDEIGTSPFDVALVILLVGLRRRGFRNLICNRAVARFPLDKALVYPTPAIAELKGDHPWKQDALRAREWLAAMPERSWEEILAGSVSSDGRVQVLLDCRSMYDRHSGTAHAMLGYLDGLTELGTPELEFTVLTSTAAALFHELESRYSIFRIQIDRPEGRYLVAIRLDQPWSLDTILELHEHALFIAFNIQDTIAWDIIFAAPDGLDQVWRLLPHLADALLFISNYTRERFIFRFRPDRSMPLVVAHLSLDIQDLTRGSIGASPFEEPYILIFGNSLDHKAVAPTLATLADAFPYTRIVAVGYNSAPSPRVTALQDGRVGNAEINTLMATAAVVVYPSYYEGFGLPVVHGLAYGRIVIVRDSPLWHEIAAYADLPGTLVPFNHDVELVEAVGCALHGLPVRGLAFGGAIAAGGSVPSWRACARHLTELVRNLALTHNPNQWAYRQAMLKSLRSVTETARRGESVP
jgi:glycosyltransferase involved in cell wall biosynthesis